MNQKRSIYIIAVLLWFSQYIYIPYQTPYLASIGIASSMIGVIVGAYGFPQFLLRLFVGLSADRKPRHRALMTLGVVSTGLASVLRVFVPGALGFLLGSILSGVASSTWVSYMVVYPALHREEEQTAATGRIVAANNLGILSAFVLASLVYERLGMTFLCAAGIAASLAALAMTFTLREPPHAARPLPARELLRVLGDRRVILFAVFNLVQQGTVSSTALSFTTQLAKTLTSRELLVGLCSVVYIATAFATASLTGRRPFRTLGPRVMIPVILAGLAVYCLLVPHARSVYQIYLLQVLAGFSQGMFQSFCTREGTAHIPAERKSTAMGYYQSIYAVGLTLFPMFVGVVVQNANMRAAYYTLSAVIAAAVACALLHYRKAGTRAHAANT